MFRTFRKKQVKEPVEEPLRKTSLPDITSQDVQWPEDLVDVAAIRHSPPPESQLQGAAPISFQPHEPGTTSFHKPFRRFLGRSHDAGDRTISSIYTSHPPSSFPSSPGPPTRASQRRTRVPPKFNLMVSLWSRQGHVSADTLIRPRLLALLVPARPPSCAFYLTLQTSLPPLPWNNARRSTGSCAAAPRLPLASNQLR
jgi:hypothetical protein